MSNERGTRFLVCINLNELQLALDRSYIAFRQQLDPAYEALNEPLETDALDSVQLQLCDAGLTLGGCIVDTIRRKGTYE